jgi:predicted metalloprotease with PDZ domain
MRTWTVFNPQLAETLFGSGLAYDPAHAVPSYYYSLFRTADGEMRTYVRPGGPAYVAGLRTGDIVEKIDGQFWWNYGTFQAQARANDGKPHNYVIKGRTADRTIQLGVPFTP